jgi:hypothetical protein
MNTPHLMVILQHLDMARAVTISGDEREDLDAIRLRLRAMLQKKGVFAGKQHVAARAEVRGTCEKCGTQTNWIVEAACGRPNAYWCGCD